MLLPIEDLEILHDAIVCEIAIDFKDVENRSIEFVLIVAPDAMSSWDGKRVRVRLESIVQCSITLFGAITGQERINSWGGSVSAGMNLELQRLEALGINCSGERYNISFQSGSGIEGLCHRVTVEEVPVASTSSS